MTTTLIAPAPAPNTPPTEDLVLRFDWNEARRIVRERCPDWASAVLMNEDGGRGRVIYEAGEFFGAHALESSIEIPTLLLHADDCLADVEIPCYSVEMRRGA